MQRGGGDKGAGLDCCWLPGVGRLGMAVASRLGGVQNVLNGKQECNIRGMDGGGQRCDRRAGSQ